MMIEPVSSILILAADDGMDTTIQLVLFAVIAIGSIIAAVFKKAGEKRQQEQARRHAEEAKEILTRRAQREQTRQTASPPKEATFGTMKKTASPRDFIQGRTTTPPPPLPKPQLRPSMFAAPPKPVSVEESHLTERTPIKHLPAGDELVHSVMPSQRGEKRTASVGDFIRKREQPTLGRIERNVPEVRDVLELTEPNVRTRVNLMDPAIARAAIIFQEILSPPKALRDKPEMWD